MTSDVPRIEGAQRVSADAGAGEYPSANFQAIDPAINKAAVLSLMGYSAPTLWRRIRAGVFPRPFMVGPRSPRWTLSEVLASRDKLRNEPTAAARPPQG